MILESLPAAFWAMHRYFMIALACLLSRKEYDSIFNFALSSSQLALPHENHVYFTSGGLTSSVFFNEQLIIILFLKRYVAANCISGFTVKNKRIIVSVCSYIAYNCELNHHFKI
jgi:hypothetical protein